MKRIVRLAFYSLAAMIITACGGGGGGGGGAPVGLHVVSTIPAKNATGVPTATKVSATFSAAVAPPLPFTNISSVPFANLTSVFTLKKTSDITSTPINGTMASSTDAKTWTFTPDASLDPGTNYTATFKGGPNGVTAAATGKPMAKDYVWSFTTSDWNGTQMLGTIVNDKAYGVVTDASGNIYMTGSTQGGLDGVLNADNTATGGTTYDAFLVKYNAAGVKQWTALLGTIYNDEAFGIAIDGSGNIYVAGYTNGSLPGLGNTANPSPGVFSNAFVAKFNAAGVAGSTAPSAEWVRQSSTAFNNKAYGVAVDSVGNIYVAGETGDTAADATSGDIFLTQYSSAGVANWTKTLASTTAAKDRAYGVAVNGGNIYVAGFTNGVLAGAPAGTANQGGADLFVAQFDAVAANLTPVWVRQFGTAGTDVAFAVAADTSGVYAAGSSGLDAFLIKYSPAGTSLWSHTLGTAGVDEAFGVTLDASGNVYITGDTEGVLPGTPAGTVNQGLADLFLAKYSAAGAVSWVRQQGSVQTDAGFAVAFNNASSSLFVVGYTFGTLPGVNVHFNNADPTGITADMFLTRYDTSGVLIQ